MRCSAAVPQLYFSRPHTPELSWSHQHNPGTSSAPLMSSSIRQCSSAQFGGDCEGLPPALWVPGQHTVCCSTSQREDSNSLYPNPGVKRLLWPFRWGVDNSALSASCRTALPELLPQQICDITVSELDLGSCISP